MNTTQPERKVKIQHLEKNHDITVPADIMIKDLKTRLTAKIGNFDPDYKLVHKDKDLIDF
jgi:hypothetical protein